MVLTIYAPLFASSKRAVVTLVEKGVEFETVNVDLLKGEQRQPEYIAIQVHHLSLFFNHVSFYALFLIRYSLFDRCSLSVRSLCSSTVTTKSLVHFFSFLSRFLTSFSYIYCDQHMSEMK